MNITEIAFEHITDTYSWGRYGEFRVIIDTRDGYINATQLCRQAENLHGKSRKLNDFTRSTFCIELIGQVMASTGYPVGNLLRVPTGLPNELRGTYVHPDLIPHIASWASVQFAIKVSRIVNEYIVREYRDTIRAKDTTIDRLERKIDEQTAMIARQSAEISELLGHTRNVGIELENTQIELESVATDVATVTAQLTTVSTQLTTVQDKLDIAVQTRVPPDTVDNRNEVLAVYFSVNIARYRVVRCQLCSWTTAHRRCLDAGYTVEIYHRRDPNAVNIWNRVRSTMPADVGTVVGGFYIQGVTDRLRLIHFIEKVRAEKFNV